MTGFEVEWKKMRLVGLVWVELGIEMVLEG